ncbi:hypothetical protein RU639_006099 [Aspergillus parasiticus]
MCKELQKEEAFAKLPRAKKTDECLKTSRATKLTKLPQLKEFANRSSSLLELSGEIRAGIQTDTSRLSLLTAHVDCFKELCRAISHLCCFIQHALLVKFQGIGTRSDQPDSETLDQSSDLDKANEHIPVAGYSNADIPEASNMTRYTGEDREISWHISPQSTGTAGTLGDRIYAPSYRVPSPIASILGNRNMGDTSLSRRQRTDPRERAWDDSESSKSDLEDHKISLADGCQAPQQAEDYVIESKYSIICTFFNFEHISLGLSDLDSAGLLYLEEIYREYSSPLRIKMRDKPTQSLLDDLDLLEEELESILGHPEAEVGTRKICTVR